MGGIAKIKLLFVLIAWVPASVWAAPSPAVAPEELTLDQALRRAFAHNHSIQVARLGLESSELDYKNAWDKMFTPSVTLGATTGASHTLLQIPGSGAASLGDAGKQRGYPYSTLDLRVANYTLFNFWRDRISYDVARLDYERNKQLLTETERMLRFNVIRTYFSLKTSQDKQEAAKRSIDIAQAILGLIRSKVANGKATERDVSSSVVDVLDAKNQYNEQSRITRSGLWNLNFLLGAPIDTPYVLKSELKHSPLQLGAEKAMKLFRDLSPSMRSATLALRKSEMGLELAEKNRLPLPTITVTGMQISYSNSYYGQAVNKYTDQTNGSLPGNIDIATTLGVTIPIWGEGGFLGSRTVGKARIARDQAEVGFQLAAMQGQTNIYSLITTIKQQEENLANYKEAFENSTTLLDGLTAAISSGTVSRLELRDAVNQARQSEFNYKDALIEHLSNKLQLAETIGVDALPGDVL